MCASCIDQELVKDAHERTIQECFDNEPEANHQACEMAYNPCEDENLDWETVYNNWEDNVFKTCFCAYGGSECGYYLQTCGGGPEGGYVLSLDKKSAWEVTRTWHQPFTLTPLSTKLAVRISKDGQTEVASMQYAVSHYLLEHQTAPMTHCERKAHTQWVEPEKPAYPALYQGPKKRSTRYWRVWSLYYPKEALAFNTAMDAYYKERKAKWNLFVGKVENNLVGLETTIEA